MGTLLECGWRVRLHHQNGQHTLSELQLLSQGKCMEELEDTQELLREMTDSQLLRKIRGFEVCNLE